MIARPGAEMSWLAEEYLKFPADNRVLTAVDIFLLCIFGCLSYSDISCVPCTGAVGTRYAAPGLEIHAHRWQKAPGPEKGAHGIEP